VISITLTKRQKEELAKYCMDVSKLMLGSWVFVLFTGNMGLAQALLAFWGLIISGIFFRIGLGIFKEVR